MLVQQCGDKLHGGGDRVWEVETMVATSFRNVLERCAKVRTGGVKVGAQCRKVEAR